jgi:hypothetical protein
MKEKQGEIYKIKNNSIINYILEDRNIEERKNERENMGEMKEREKMEEGKTKRYRRKKIEWKTDKGSN